MSQRGIDPQDRSANRVSIGPVMLDGWHRCSRLVFYAFRAKLCGETKPSAVLVEALLWLTSRTSRAHETSRPGHTMIVANKLTAGIWFLANSEIGRATSVKKTGIPFVAVSRVWS